ncbi:MAG: GNAT family N-acetyltransferase [Actinomycetota bacterium]
MIHRSEPYARATAGLLNAWRMVGAASPAGQVRELPGGLIASMGTPSPITNRAFVIDDQADADQVIGSIVEFYRGRDLPFTLQIHEHLPVGFRDAATAAGLKESERIPMMALTPIAGTLRTASPDLEIRAAATEEELAWAADVGVRGFGSEDARAFATPAIARAGAHYFVGLVAGRPVGTSMVVPDARAAGIYGVATDPGFRRRGIGETLTATAVLHGSDQGCDLAYLESSEAGFRVYERIGFVTVGWSIAFVKKALS